MIRTIRNLLTRRALFAWTCLAVVSTTGCYQRMSQQPKLKPQQPSDFFADKRSSRPQEIGTIARTEVLNEGDEYLQEDSHYYTGKKENAAKADPTKPETVLAQYESTFPARVTVDEQFLKRGQERYNIYCAVCHGQTGNANGTIVQRGFLRPPAFYPVKIVGGRDGEPAEFEADFHSRGLGYLGAKKIPLWKAPAGYIFSVITNGYGGMASYSAQVPTQDRWAIVAYIRALQYSQSEQARTELVASAENPARSAALALNQSAQDQPAQDQSGQANPASASANPSAARKDGNQ